MSAPPFRLMLVTDRSLLPPGGLVDAVDQAVSGGVDAVQLRERDMLDEDLLALGRSLRAVTRGRAMLLVNGSGSLARAIAADGVHLPEAAPYPDEKRGTSQLMGRSVHDVDGVKRTAAEGLDYLILGTIFPSRSHPGGRTGGLDLVRSVCAQTRTPVIAIGGITSANAGAVREAGAAGIAVISAVLCAPDPRAAAAALATIVRSAPAVG